MERAGTTPAPSPPPPPRPAPPAKSSAPAVPDAGQSEPAIATAVNSPDQLWPEVVRLASASRRLRALIDGLTLAAYAEGRVELSVQPAMIALARSSAKELEELVAKAAGKPVSLTLRDSGAAGIAAPGQTAGVETAPTGDIRQHPLVKAAEDLFGARVVRVDSKPR